jgi:hypothetical protein
VVVRRRIGLESRQSMMGADLMNQPVLFERFEILVHCREGYRRDVLFDHVVHRLGTRVIVHSGERLEDDLPLMRNCEPVAFTQVAEAFDWNLSVAHFSQ